MIERMDKAEALGVSFTPHAESQRVRFAGCGFAMASPQKALEAVQTGLSSAGQVVLEGVQLAPLEHSNCPDGAAQVISAGANRVVVQVNAPLAGWLVLNDVWYPGWKASVDGERVEIYRADYLFRAVPVPAGTHQVTFVYRPVSFYSGVGLSAAAWLLLWVGWLRSSKRGSERGKDGNREGEIEN